MKAIELQNKGACLKNAVEFDTKQVPSFWYLKLAGIREMSPDPIHLKLSKSPP